MNVQKMNWKNLHINSGWTLFLDRDGVINRKIDGDYVRNLPQFEWLPGVQEALKKLASVFGRIIIVTNQQGVGKGLMSGEDVELIHQHMIKEVKKTGGRIDHVYFSPHLKQENSDFRKPGIGMALMAKEDFPEIDFTRSIMVGDSASDMEFGKIAGMITVFITNGKTLPEQANLIDHSYVDLSEFTSKFSQSV